jgi:hypothetical protein
MSSRQGRKPLEEKVMGLTTATWPGRGKTRPVFAPLRHVVTLRGFGRPFGNSPNLVSARAASTGRTQAQVHSLEAGPFGCLRSPAG